MERLTAVYQCEEISQWSQSKVMDYKMIRKADCAWCHLTVLVNNRAPLPCTVAATNLGAMIRSGVGGTYYMDEVRKDSCCLGVPQRTCSILRFVSCQKTIIQERIITPDTELVDVLKVYASNDLKLLTCNHGVLVVSFFSIEHFFVRLHVPIIIVFVFDRGFVENLGWADVVVASESTEMQSCFSDLRLRDGRGHSWRWHRWSAGWPFRGGTKFYGIAIYRREALRS